MEIKVRYKIVWPGVNGSSVNNLVCCDYRDFLSLQEYLSAITRYGLWWSKSHQIVLKVPRPVMYFFLLAYEYGSFIAYCSLCLKDICINERVSQIEILILQ